MFYCIHASEASNKVTAIRHSFLMQGLRSLSIGFTYCAEHRPLCQYRIDVLFCVNTSVTESSFAHSLTNWLLPFFISLLLLRVAASLRRCVLSPVLLWQEIPHCYSCCCSLRLWLFPSMLPSSVFLAWVGLGDAIDVPFAFLDSCSMFLMSYVDEMNYGIMDSAV